MANPGPASTTTIHPQTLSANQAVRLLAYGSGVSVGTAGDAAITMPVISTSTYNVTQVVMTNANKDISGGALAIWTGPAGTGTEIVTNASLTSMTTAAYVVNATVVTATKTVNLAAQTIYVKVGTAVAGGTLDIFVYGYDFSTFS